MPGAKWRLNTPYGQILNVIKSLYYKEHNLCSVIRKGCPEEVTFKQDLRGTALDQIHHSTDIQMSIFVQVIY